MLQRRKSEFNRRDSLLEIPLNQLGVMSPQRLQSTRTHKTGTELMVDSNGENRNRLEVERRMATIQENDRSVE